MISLADLPLYQGPEHHPFALGRGPHGALLLHGFTGTPAEVRPLGERLARAGWHARAPLLPGFGEDIASLKQRGRADWLATVRREWQALAVNHAPLVMIGYSMGAALALRLASELQPTALVLVAPFWHVRGWLPRLVPLARWLLPHWRPFRRADFSDARLRASFERILLGVDLEEVQVQELIRREFTLPLKAIDEVLRLGRDAYRQAPNASLPTLVLQGQRDELVLPSETRRLVQRLPNARLVELEAGHDILLSDQPGLERAAAEIQSFLSKVVGQVTPASPTPTLPPPGRNGRHPERLEGFAQKR